MKSDSLLRSDCVFCRIVSRRIDAEVLFENQDALCILDINPIHFGHSLVLPKRHCRNFLELPSSMFQGVMDAAQAVSQATVSALELEGFNIFCNNGRIAGQSVFHFHLHITPRYKDDDIKFVLELKKYGNKEMEHYGSLIRKSLAQRS